MSFLNIYNGNVIIFLIIISLFLSLFLIFLINNLILFIINIILLFFQINIIINYLLNINIYLYIFIQCIINSVFLILILVYLIFKLFSNFEFNLSLFFFKRLQFLKKIFKKIFNLYKIYILIIYKYITLKNLYKKINYYLIFKFIFLICLYIFFSISFMSLIIFAKGIKTIEKIVCPCEVQKSHGSPYYYGSIKEFIFSTGRILIGVPLYSYLLKPFNHGRVILCGCLCDYCTRNRHAEYFTTMYGLLILGYFLSLPFFNSNDKQGSTLNPLARIKLLKTNEQFLEMLNESNIFPGEIITSSNFSKFLNIDYLIEIYGYTKGLSIYIIFMSFLKTIDKIFKDENLNKNEKQTSKDLEKDIEDIEDLEEDLEEDFTTDKEFGDFLSESIFNDLKEKMELVKNSEMSYRREIPVEDYSQIALLLDTFNENPKIHNLIQNISNIDLLTYYFKLVGGTVENGCLVITSEFVPVFEIMIKTPVFFDAIMFVLENDKILISENCLEACFAIIDLLELK